MISEMECHLIIFLILASGTAASPIDFAKEHTNTLALLVGLILGFTLVLYILSCMCCPIGGPKLRTIFVLVTVGLGSAFIGFNIRPLWNKAKSVKSTVSKLGILGKI